MFPFSSADHSFLEIPLFCFLQTPFWAATFCVQMSFVSLDPKLCCDLLLWYSKSFLAMLCHAWFFFFLLVGKNKIPLLVFFILLSLTIFYPMILLSKKKKSQNKVILWLDCLSYFYKWYISYKSTKTLV